MSPRRAVPDKNKTSGLPTSLIVGALVVVAIIAIIVGADLLTKSQTPASGIASSGRTAGDVKAPISFVEFSDFQ